MINYWESIISYLLILCSRLNPKEFLNMSGKLQMHFQDTNWWDICSGWMKPYHGGSKISSSISHACVDLESRVEFFMSWRRPRSNTNFIKLTSQQYSILWGHTAFCNVRHSWVIHQKHLQFIRNYIKISSRKVFRSCWNLKIRMLMIWQRCIRIWLKL